MKKPIPGRQMLDEMIFQAKIWYSMIYLFPKRNPWEILGYDKNEWDWMLRGEGQIWKHYLDNQVLFSNNFNDYTLPLAIKHLAMVSHPNAHP